MACDDCGIWKHTRCCGIADDDVEPVSFLCPDCLASAAAEAAAQQPKLLNVAERGRKARQQQVAGREAMADAGTGTGGDDGAALKKQNGLGGA